jgi:hypothetical protein
MFTQDGSPFQAGSGFPKQGWGVPTGTFGEAVSRMRGMLKSIHPHISPKQVIYTIIYVMLLCMMSILS